MGANFELFSRFLIDMNPAVDRKPLNMRRQGNRAENPSAGPFRRGHNFVGRLIEQAMVKGSEPNSDILIFQRVSFTSVC